MNPMFSLCCADMDVTNSVSSSSFSLHSSSFTGSGNTLLWNSKRHPNHEKLKVEETRPRYGKAVQDYLGCYHY